MSVARFLAKSRCLPFKQRVELAHRLWDKFMDGFQGWAAPPMPKNSSRWKTLKLEIDASLTRTQRIRLAQRVWEGIIEGGYDPEPSPEFIAELEKRVEELRRHPERGIPWEKVRADVRRRLARLRKSKARQPA